MALDIGKAKQFTRKLRIVWTDLDEETNLRYSPLALDGMDNAEFIAFSRTESPQRAVAFWIERVVKEWDLVLNGKVVPLTAEGLKAVPISVLSEIRDAIFADEVVSPLRSPASKSGSSAEEPTQAAS